MDVSKGGQRWPHRSTTLSTQPVALHPVGIAGQKMDVSRAVRQPVALHPVGIAGQKMDVSNGGQASQTIKMTCVRRACLRNSENRNDVF